MAIGPRPDFFLALGRDNRRDEIFRSGIPNVRDGVRAKHAPGANAASSCWRSQHRQAQQAHVGVANNPPKIGGNQRGVDGPHQPER
jgi:hypothetical protein